MKTKLITITLSAVLAASLLALTACGTTEEATVSSAVESSVISETSASLGIYIQDTDNDGTPDKVVDRYGNDLSELYTLKEDGIYEGETLVLPMEHVQTYTTLEGEVNSEESAENTEQPTEQPTEQSVNTNVNTAGNSNANPGTYPSPRNGNTGGNGGSNTNTGTAAKPQQEQQQQTAAPAPQPQVHAPVYKQVWVVDQAAWSEEVPVWGNKLVWICNTCGADITDDVYGHIDITMHGGYHDNMIKVQTGTQTIHHDEVGHWESVLVCGGCTGTH